MAQDHGSFAAFNMLGKMVPYGRIPFFWTRHYNKSLQYVGFADPKTVDEVYVQGSLSENKFVAYYIKDNKVLAAAGQQNSGAILTLKQALESNVMPPAYDIKSGKETIDTIAAKIRQNKGSAKCIRENCCHKKPVQA